MIPENWNQIQLKLPQPHILQSAEWAEHKREVGWQAEPLILAGSDGLPVAGALVLTRSVNPLRFGPKFSVCYVPRGPLLDWHDAYLGRQALDAIEMYCRSKKAIFIKIDPEVILGTGIPGSEGEIIDPTGSAAEALLTKRGWRYSSEQIQFKNTVLIDLVDLEDTWMSRMKQKTRYNIRLAQRNGVVVRRGEHSDLSDLYRMYAKTADRDGFIIRKEDYYLKLWHTFMDAGLAIPLIAEVEGDAVAGLILFVFGKRAWYFYGMSTPDHREKMPNYLLQWEAMRIAKSLGCSTYDLWGAPDTFDGDDNMAGVFRFKEGLGGILQRTIGAWDYPTRPFLYFLYQHILPWILDLTRFIRRGKIKQEAQ
jgi:lipid II:glycine glycyltransferase (peptidoglycan interpeptide bridge formation enzyme)